jgi:hypothetical protein
MRNQGQVLRYVQSAILSNYFNVVIALISVATRKFWPTITYNWQTIRQVVGGPAILFHVAKVEQFSSRYIVLVLVEIFTSEQFLSYVLKKLWSQCRIAH